MAVHLCRSQAHRWPALVADLEARLLLAVVDGLMFDAVTAPGTLSPAQLEAGPDAYLDRLLGTTGRQPEHSGLRSTA
ncbi:MAG TPA: TetR family transcriptional regulator C-terminal domain-containing protein [Streptosporangiaceae bacterium]